MDKRFMLQMMEDCLRKLTYGNFILLGENHKGYIVYLKTFWAVLRAEGKLPKAPDGKLVTYKEIVDISMK